MNCPDCGNPIEDGAQFCPKCYARIEPAGFWRRFLSYFGTPKTRYRSVVNIKKSVVIKTTDK
ncbi:MAG TPA: zinc-ribbon domain-containing protein, partial [Verrucomicrobiae bacterium]|nr:zinc-ribbon domain-containing protein [Verrucomicrobiae bacterium]